MYGIGLSLVENGEDATKPVINIAKAFPVAQDNRYDNESLFREPKPTKTMNEEKKSLVVLHTVDQGAQMVERTTLKK